MRRRRFGGSSACHDGSSTVTSRRVSTAGSVRLERLIQRAERVHDLSRIVAPVITSLDLEVGLQEVDAPGGTG